MRLVVVVLTFALALPVLSDTVYSGQRGVVGRRAFPAEHGDRVHGPGRLF